MDTGPSIASFTLGQLPIELAVLLLSIVLGLVQLILAAAASTKDRGAQWGAGPRDGAPPPLGNHAGRLDRAFKNFQETFPFFAVAVLVAWTAGRLGSLTALGATLYLLGRIAFVPLYAGGVPVFRSIAWGIALAGIILVLIGAFLPN